MKILAKIFEWLTGITLGQLAYLALFALFYATAIAFYFALIFGAIQLYNFSSTILDLLTTGASVYGSAEILCKFYGLLNCVGFVAGFEAGKPALFSAIVFFFTKLAYLLYLQAYGLLLHHLSKLLIK